MKDSQQNYYCLFNTVIKMILTLILTLVFSITQASDIVVTSSVPPIDYPVRFAYINRIADWSSARGIARSIGLPGYAPSHRYNFVCFTFWTCADGPLDAALLWNKSTTYFGTSVFGSTDAEVRANIKRIYNSNGIRVMVSAFGATQKPTTMGLNATTCALKLADYVANNNLDGVDIDWQDTAAFSNRAFRGEEWLINLTTVLRSKLPAAIITHAPQAPYFGGTALYPNNGYLAVEQRVGSMIQFYNVQFYNQGSTPYNTARGLFNASGGWAAGTSVNQIIARGVPSNKIVVGKAATTIDANPASFMTASSIADAIVANYRFNRWQAGVMFWQYSSDPNGTICATAITPLLNLLNITTPTNITQNTTTNSSNITGNTTNNNTTNTTNTNTTNTTTNSSVVLFPVRFTYIQRIMDWSSPIAIARSLGIPGYAPNHIYTHICLSVWTNRFGPVNIAQVWHDPIFYFGTASPFGANNAQIRARIKQLYASRGIKLMLGVFGTVQLPAFIYDANRSAQALARYATDYSYDGVDINWNDIFSFTLGRAEAWLSTFTLALSRKAPNLIITHSPLATYFSSSAISFPSGGYVQVHRLAGSAISFYNVIFFGQSQNISYNTASSLFNVSGGSISTARTSVSEIIAKGIPGSKIVVGKAALGCADPASYIAPAALGQAFLAQFNFNRWYTGVMLYHYSCDLNGSAIQAIMAPFRARNPTLFK